MESGKVEKLIQLRSAATSVSIEPSTNLLTICTEVGEILQLHSNADGEKGSHEDTDVILRTGGAPGGVVFDSNGRLFIADMAHRALLTYNDGEESVTNIVDEYEDEPFKGPNSLGIDSTDAIYFTDSGPFGQTTLQNAVGSLFVITGAERTLQPILLRCLAGATGVTVSADDQCVYLCETIRNRVLRVVQRPEQVFHCTVFHQFSGGLGPTALCVDSSGNVYVARAELDHVQGGQGLISVLDSRGRLLGDVEIPAPEIASICFGSIENPFLYMAESSTQSIYRLPIASLPI